MVNDITIICIFSELCFAYSGGILKRQRYFEMLSDAESELLWVALGCSEKSFEQKVEITNKNGSNFYSDLRIRIK